ncbi:hypothetical protein OQA88_10517 [Cercophora sp. LCS_1]
MPSNKLLPEPSRPFDTWNSSSTGHQRAEARGPQGWRESRTAKLQSQFRHGATGGPRMQDSVGRGAAEYDEELDCFVPKEVRARAKNSVADMLRNPGTMLAPEEGVDEGKAAEERLTAKRNKEDEERERQMSDRKLFDGVVIYVNGSTYPTISDHKLKQVLVGHGAKTSLHLGRRQVTHVIIGKPSAVGSGAGGGLAAGKLEKEIRRVGGCAVKFVDVAWVLESIKAGKRLPESRFATLKIAARGQQSVLGAFGKKATATTTGGGKAQGGAA